MDVKGYYGTCKKIPLYALRLLRDKGVITDPLREDDLIFLDALSSAWGDTDLLRIQIKALNKPARETLIQTADFRERWERYVYSRFWNNKPSVGKTPTVPDVVREVLVRFTLDDFWTKERVTARVKKIKKRVVNKRAHAARKANEKEGEGSGSSLNGAMNDG